MRTRQSTRGRRVTLVVASVSDDEEYDDPAADDDDDDAYHEEATETASRAAEDDSDLDASLDELDDAASVTTDGLGGAAGPLATGDEDNVSALTLYGLSQNKRAMYMGPVRRSTQSTLLLRELYGPDPDNVAIAWGLLGRWPPTRVLPSKLPHPDICTVPSPWVAEGFEESQRALLRDLLTEAQHGGLGRPASAFTRLKPEDGRRYLPPSAGDEIVTFSGRHGGEMKRLVFRQGASVLTSYAGEPLCDDENLPASECGGWMIDVGGTVVGMAWAPLDGEGDQVLGLSVIPFADQTASKSKSDTVSDSATTTGSIQLWCFPSQDADGGFVRPSKERPKLVQTICTDRDGITTLQWCPLPYSSDSTLGILAFLSRDGMVRVIAVSKDRGEETIFNMIDEPLASLGFPDDPLLKATAFTWVNLNRVAVGHSDGSVSLWSIIPQRLLQRHQIHGGYIIDMCSGYPSRPFVVSTKSLSGLQALTDLSRPTVEVSEQGISTYTFQPGLVCWSDHLLGFIDVWPATMVGGTTIGFAHVEHYCHMRHVADVSAPPTCCAVGTQHPFVLVGAADGTLVCVNPAARVFRSRTTRAFKVTVFQHDHVGTTVSKNGTMDGSSEQRLSKGPSRGAARIVHGFAPQINEHNKAEKMRRLMQELRRKAQKGRDQNRASDRRRRQRGRQPHQGSGGHPESRPIAVDADDAPGDVKMSDVVDTHDSGHARTEQAPHPKAVVEPVIFEPLTRVTCVAWNPNAEYGWWAAAALGSGLVKVMDLGDETPAENNW